MFYGVYASVEWALSVDILHAACDDSTFYALNIVEFVELRACRTFESPIANLLLEWCSSADQDNLAVPYWAFSGTRVCLCL